MTYGGGEQTQSGYPPTVTPLHHPTEAITHRSLRTYFSFVVSTLFLPVTTLSLCLRGESSQETRSRLSSLSPSSRLFVVNHSNKDTPSYSPPPDVSEVSNFPPLQTVPNRQPTKTKPILSHTPPLDTPPKIVGGRVRGARFILRYGSINPPKKPAV